jgi:hypothetical protein
MLPRIALAIAIMLLTLAGDARTRACGPFLGLAASSTLREDAATSRVVLYGTLANPRVRGGAKSGEGTTDVKVQGVLKGSAELKGRLVIEIPRHIPIADPQNPPAYLIFFDLKRGTVDRYHRGVPVESTAMLEYLKGAMRLEPKKSSEFLSYFFRHLDHTDPVIANDALLEFAKIDYRDVPSWAKGLPAEKIASWLEKPNLPPARIRLYAPLLGDCGGERHADLLRRLLEQARKRDGDQGIDGLLLGYTILRPKEGWAYLREILAEPSSPFLVRFSAVGTIRFLWGAREGLIAKEDLSAGIVSLLAQTDMADISVEELRRVKQWQYTEQVLGCYDKKSHAAPIIRRSIIRYALSCPNVPMARSFIAERRKVDPELIRDIEEYLAMELATESASRPTP